MEWDQIADRWAAMAQRLRHEDAPVRRAGPNLSGGQPGAQTAATIDAPRGAGLSRRGGEPDPLATPQARPADPGAIQPSGR